MISIILPAYKAEKWIIECLNSIKSNIPFEILVGIDNCEKTRELVLGSKFDIRAFFFYENVGPFVVKNSLIKECGYENILFFDSDDLMLENTIEKVSKLLINNSYLKLNYINFRPDRISNKILNDAVIAIKKETFLKLNGFQPWRCAADTEFDYRLKFNKVKPIITETIDYHRRIHSENLILKPETKHGSILRQSYKDIIDKNSRDRNWPNPKILHCANYTATN